jgi:hypothetical protein
MTAAKELKLRIADSHMVKVHNYTLLIEIQLLLKIFFNYQQCLQKLKQVGFIFDSL